MLKSFGHAIRGLKVVAGSELNFRIHLLAAMVVVVFGIILQLTTLEWSIVVISMLAVLSMECMNTAIERLVDFVSPGFHEQAGMVKDISAAAVLLTAIGAAVAGSFVFLPRIIHLF